MAEGTLRRKTKHGLLWAGGEAGVRALLQLAVLAVLARLLTPEHYGIVGAGLIVVGIATIFAQLGVGPAIVQREKLESSHLNAAFVVSLLLGLITAAIIYFGAPVLAALFRIPALSETLHALAVIFPIAGLGVVHEASLQRKLRFDVIARIEVGSYFLGYACLGTALAATGWGAWSLVWAQVAQSSVKTTLLFVAVPWRPRLQFEREAFQDLWEFSGGVTVARIANYIAISADGMVVGRQFGAQTLGIYNRAYTLMVVPATLIGQVLDKVLFPAMAKVQNDDAKLRHVYRHGVGMLASLMLPVSVATYLLAPEIVLAALGPKWTGAVMPLQLFSAALLCRTSVKLSTSLLRAKGAVSSMAVCQVVYATATIVFAWIGSRWGLAGVCIGVLASNVFGFLLGAGMSLRVLGLRWREFATAHLPGSGLGLMAFCVGSMTCHSLRAHHAGAWPTLLITLAAIAAAIGVVGMLFPRTFFGPEGARLQGQARLLIFRGARAM